MPQKVCPKCGLKFGVRKLECDCGHDFNSSRTRKTTVKVGRAPHPLYPEPGAWVLDKMKGMPVICPPEDLPRGPVDTLTIKDIVEYEGLGYAVYSFIPAKRISDPQLRKLWREARAAMQEIVEYLEEVPLP